MGIITVSVNRAHKIAERISAKMNEERQSVTSMNGSFRFNSMPTKDQLDRVRAAKQEFLNSVETYTKLATVLAGVREVIAKANISNGVSELLSVMEANKKTINLLSSAVDVSQESTMSVRVDDVSNIVWPEGSTYERAYVEVTPFTGEATDFEIRKKELERQNFALNDKLSDLNSAMVDIDIPDEYVNMLGL